MTERDYSELSNKGANTFAYSDEDINRILSSLETEQLIPIESIPQSDVAKELLNLQKKEIHTSLHVSTLAEYIKTKRIPRGLRLDIKPNLCAEDQLLQQRWLEICNKCSIDLMVLTVERLTVKLHEIRTAITASTAKLTEERGAEQCNKILSDHKDILERLRSSITDRKRAKFNRDAKDYQEGKVYTWREERKWQRSEHQQRTGLPAPFRNQRRGASQSASYTQRGGRKGFPTQLQGASAYSTSSGEDLPSSSGSAPFLEQRSPTQEEHRKDKHGAKKAPDRESYPKRNRKQIRP
ncbi:uncharacterized protein LOC121402944 [Xenopus laevis]|uniref:Uncharacterized protein LOC121399504 n=1 Tax=Xenopus laevis TaxID=8355 RepID=A0A8J1M3V6_XENLA|nr:uncharacterized protein LOC121399504 [Xenopus laevis]XP_041445886.1 uncharacterized protein LOC121402944 [Xenopus laevis]